jgi:hypothetical protein
VLALAGHWMLDKLGHFAITSFTSTSTHPMQIAPELHTPEGG